MIEVVFDYRNETFVPNAFPLVNPAFQFDFDIYRFERFCRNGKNSIS